MIVYLISSPPTLSRDCHNQCFCWGSGSGGSGSSTLGPGGERPPKTPIQGGAAPQPQIQGGVQGGVKSNLKSRGASPPCSKRTGEPEKISLDNLEPGRIPNRILCNFGKSQLCRLIRNFMFLLGLVYVYTMVLNIFGKNFWPNRPTHPA